MAIPTDKDGLALLTLTARDAGVDTHNSCKGCGASGAMNPVVRYDDSFRVHAGYVLCQLRKPDYSWLAIQDFSQKEFFQHGIATANTCGKGRSLTQAWRIGDICSAINLVGEI